MPVTIATHHFLGSEGHEKKNCAQAVLKAFQHSLDIPENIVDSFQAFGGGRAPEGVCGAAFAAEFLLGMLDIDDSSVNAVEDLHKNAGSAKCKEIKAAGRMSCLDCVQSCTKYVEKALESAASIEINTMTS